MPFDFIHPLDSTLLAPSTRSVALRARVLAGSFFRPTSWPSTDAAALRAAAAYTLRVGVTADSPHRMAVQVSATPLAAGNPSYISVPSRLVHAALALAIAEQSDPSPHLDEAFDLLAGYALTVASHAPTATGAASSVGFGFTMPPISGSYEDYIVALYDDDARVMTVRDGATPMQTRLAAAALAALAKQYADEASDGDRAPLDRARRVRAAIVIDADSTFSLAGDALAAALAEYADACRLDDDDGRLAWAMFGTGGTSPSSAKTEKQKSENAKRHAQGDAISHARCNSTDVRNGETACTMQEDEPTCDARLAKSEAARLADEAAELAKQAHDDATMLPADAAKARAKRARDRKAAASKAAKAAAKAAKGKEASEATGADDASGITSLANDVLTDAAVSQMSAGSTSTKCKAISIDA